MPRRTKSSASRARVSWSTWAHCSKADVSKWQSASGNSQLSKNCGAELTIPLFQNSSNPSDARLRKKMTESKSLRRQFIQNKRPVQPTIRRLTDEQNEQRNWPDERQA